MEPLTKRLMILGIILLGVTAAFVKLESILGVCATGLVMVLREEVSNHRKSITNGSEKTPNGD